MKCKRCKYFKDFVNYEEYEYFAPYTLHDVCQHPNADEGTPCQQQWNKCKGRDFEQCLSDYIIIIICILGLIALWGMLCAS